MGTPEEVLGPTEDSELRELNHRLGEGFEVKMLWDEGSGDLKVTVEDWRTDEYFEIPARAENVADVFKHPFAYRGSGSVALRAA